jgi:hypothetical protein
LRPEQVTGAGFSKTFAVSFFDFNRYVGVKLRSASLRAENTKWHRRLVALECGGGAFVIVSVAMALSEPR